MLGTAGIGAETARTLAPHDPSHIYITGRNQRAADALIKEIQGKHASVGMTFVEVDFTSLAAVKECVQREFKHARLDILMCTAGVMTQPPMLSKDGYGTLKCMSLSMERLLTTNNQRYNSRSTTLHMR
jgi:NAD(P)-dependent dehydrogenase (short-subunit alcohol dehydrogenase family)